MATRLRPEQWPASAGHSHAIKLAATGYSGVIFEACLPFAPCVTSKLTFLVLLQRFEAVALNLRKMREQVFAAAVGRNEPKALRIIEPLRYSCCRYLSKPRLSL
jgi:hypothetical protein